MIDFDSRKLYSINAEGIQYDPYAPKGWQGTFGDIQDLISENHRYWIDGQKDYLYERRKNYELKHGM